LPASRYQTVGEREGMYDLHVFLAFDQVVVQEELRA
jgi:hypothetical protein